MLLSYSIADFNGPDALIAWLVAAANWRKLPPEIVAHIGQITGADGSRQINQRHLLAEYPDKKKPLVYVIGHANDVGADVYGHHGNQVATLEVIQRDFFLQGDYKRNKGSPDKKGQLDPSTSVVNTDVIPFHLNTTTETAQKGSGAKARKVQQEGLRQCVILGPPYIWPDQYLTELTRESLQVFLDGLSGTFVFHLRSAPKTVEAISGFPVGAVISRETVMAGERADIPVRLGMGIEFRADFGVPSLQHMSGVVKMFQNGLIKVRVVLPASQLPPPGNDWHRMDKSTAFQTNLELWISPADVIRVIYCFPTALWQFKEKTEDRHIAASMELAVDPSVDETQTTPAMIIKGLYGDGPLSGKVKLHFHRLVPLEARLAFDIAAQSLPDVFGGSTTSLIPHQDFIARRVEEFARAKASMTNQATADNTLHLLTDGWLFLRVLDSYLTMGSCPVALEDGLFAITAPKWEDARSLLGRADGTFDFTAYGHGFVELFAPIVFKWEIYDTTNERETARSTDGFVAITFAGYEERDRHNRPDGNKDTRGHPQSKKQMYKRPSACPGFKF